MAAEVAVSLALLIGAALLTRSFGELVGRERGFQTDRRLAVEVSLPASYQPGQRGARFISDFVSRVRAIPQVVSTAAVSTRPLDDASTGMGVGASSGSTRSDEVVPWATWRLITTDYFRAMGLPLLRGRLFTEQDRAGEPWRVIISQRLADLLWPGEDPIGRQVILWKGQVDAPAEIVGVVGNMRERGLAADPTQAVYLPYNGSGRSPVTFVIHTADSPGAIVPALRSALASLDPNLPMFNIRSFEDLVSDSVASRRLTMLLLVCFAALAFLIALTGVYGVLAYTVSMRTAEIGMRLVLGATPASVVRLVVGQGMQPVVAGTVIGLAGALALSRWITSLLVGVSPTDLTSYAVVVVVLLAASALSCYLPARQALGVQLVSALGRP